MKITIWNFDDTITVDETITVTTNYLKEKDKLLLGEEKK